MKAKQVNRSILVIVVLLIVGVIAFLLWKNVNAEEAAGANYPFPQHAAQQYAVQPLQPQNKTTQQVDGMIIDMFKEFLQNDLIVDTNGPQNKEDFRMVIRHSLGYELSQGDIEWCHINVSESQGYGMLMMAYMAGSEAQLNLPSNEWIFGSTGLKDYYDAMLRTVQSYPSVIGNSLFSWELNGYMGDPNKPFGYEEVNGVKKAPFTQPADGDSATDGDMDIIYSLLLADKQWGSNGRYDYLQIALDMLDDLWTYCVHDTYNTLLLGDWAKTSDDPALQGATRPSDFIISHLKAFRDADSSHNWQAVIDATYGVIGDIIASETSQNHNYGLLPDFAVRNANGTWEVAPADLLEGSDNTFAYNACRVPWRLGTDYLLFGDYSNANYSLYSDVIEPLNGFAGSKGIENLGPVELDGTGGGESDLFNWTEPDLFATPFLVTAAAAQDQTLVDGFYTGWTTWKDIGGDNWQPFEVGISTYDGDTYGDYIQFLVMLMASGNWWQP